MTAQYGLESANLKAIAANLPITFEELMSGDPRSMLVVLNHFRNIMIALLSQPGTGRIYEHEWRMIGGSGFKAASGQLMRPVELKKVPRRGGPHQASEEGEPPAPDTSNLRDAVAVEVTGSGKNLRGRIGVGNQAYYWRFLEDGTFSFGPRPFMRPAYEAGIQGAGNELIKEIRAKTTRILRQRRVSRR